MKKTIYSCFILMFYFSLSPVQIGSSQVQSKSLSPEKEAQVVEFKKNLIDKRNDTIAELIKTVNALVSSNKPKVVYRTKVKIVEVHDTLYYPATPDDDINSYKEDLTNQFSSDGIALGCNCDTLKSDEIKTEKPKKKKNIFQKIKQFLNN